MSNSLSLSLSICVSLIDNRGDMLHLEKILAANPKFSALSLDEQRQHLSLTEKDQQEVDAAILAAHSHAQKVLAALVTGEYTPATATSVEKTRSFFFPQFVQFKQNAAPSWTANLQKSAAEVHLEVAVLEAGKAQYSSHLEYLKYFGFIHHP